MGGTLTKSRLLSGLAASTPVLVTGWNAVCRVGVVRRAHCWVLRQPAGLLVMSGGWGFLVRVRVTRFVSYLLTLAGSLELVGCWVWWCGFAWWVRPLLENCIVDASIFEIFQDCDREMMGLCTFGCVVLLFYRSSWFL